MRNKEKYLDEIAWSLGHVIPTVVELKNSLGFFDINELAEDFMAVLLNFVFDVSLRNMNEIEYNYPAIDLGDVGSKLSVQVTSDNSSSKIKDTLRKFKEKKLEQKYSKVIILILTKKKNYKTSFELPEGTDLEILDSRDLIKKIRKKDTLTIERIKDFLDEEVGRKNSETSDLTGIESEYHSELDRIRSLIRAHRPISALKLLENLKEANWNKYSSNLKFRLLTNIGACLHQTKRLKDAGKSYVEALQFKPDDEKALYNCASGWILLGDMERAEEYALKAIEKNPLSESGYSCLLLARKGKVPLEELVALVPAEILDETNISFALASVCSDLERIEDAIKWAELCLVKTTKDSFQIKGYLGSLLLHKVSVENNLEAGSLPHPSYYPLVERSYQLFSEAIDDLSSTEILSFNTELFRNRGVCSRIKGNEEAALEDLKYAVEHLPEWDDSRVVLAIIYVQSNKLTKAIEVLQPFNDVSVNIKASLMLADILRGQGEFQKCLALLNKIFSLGAELENSLFRNGKHVEACCYVEGEIFEVAVEKIDALIDNCQGDIGLMNIKAKLLRDNRQIDAAKEVTSKALELYEGSTNFTDTTYLARELCFLDMFEEATPLLEKLIQENPFHPDAVSLLICYYNTGEYKKALELVDKFNDNDIVDRRVTEIESAICESLGELDRAIGSCKEFLSASGENIAILTRLGVIFFRKGAVRELDKILSKKLEINFPHENIETITTLAQLLKLRGFKIKALEILYELRRFHFRTSSKVHKAYFEFFLMYSNEKPDSFDTSEVDVDTYFKYKFDSGEEVERLLLRCKPEEILIDEERSIFDEKMKPFIGKRVGDKISLRKRFTVSSATIVSIESKYVHAFRVSSEMLNSYFDDENCIQKVTMPENFTTLDDLPDEMKNMIASGSDRKYRFDLLMKAYQAKKITVGRVRKILGCTPFELYGDHVGNPDNVFFIHKGIAEESRSLVQALTRESLVLDIYSIITFKLLGLLDKIAKAFRHIYISQRTIDFLKEELDKKQAFPIREEGSLGVGMEGGEMKTYLTSKAILTQNLMFLTELDQWVSKNCEVSPTTESLKYNKEMVRNLEEALSEEISSSIYIGLNKKTVVVVDDLISREVMRTSFVELGVSTTRSLLEKMLADRLINKTEYYESILSLVRMNFNYIEINSDFLYFVLQKSKFSLSDDLEKIFKYLSGDMSQLDGAANLLIDVFYKLWIESLGGHRADVLASAMLDNFVESRNLSQSIWSLKNKINRRFYLLPLQRSDVLSFVDSWMKAKNEV